MTKSDYKGVSRKDLIALLNLQQGRITDLETINNLQEQQNQSLAAELETRPVLKPEEKMMMLYLRNGQGKELSRGLQYLLNSLFFTDRPIDYEQREWLIPIVEITETLNGQ